MDWKMSIISFLLVVAGACVIPFMQVPDGELVDAKTNEVQVIVHQTVTTTNLAEAAVTNIFDRQNTPNVDWFKDNSTFIWDSWKLK